MTCFERAFEKSRGISSVNYSGKRLKKMEGWAGRELELHVKKPGEESNCNLMYNFRKYNPPFIYQLLCFKRYTHRNYYDSLEISAKSSQGDIKKAYYKLSMRYHPDKAEGNEVKFREITAAYEVLGNSKLRRLYDQGVINIATRSAATEDMKAEPTKPDEESRYYRSKAPSTGRTKFYDYDEWSRMHYQKTLNREFEARKHRMARNETKYSRREEGESEQVLRFLVVFVFAVSFIGIMASGKDYDKPSPRRKD